MSKIASERETMGNTINHIDDLDNGAFDLEGGMSLPGLDWSLSSEALDQLKAIDANMRIAEQKSGSLLVG